MGLRSIGEIFCVKWMCIDNFEKSDDYIICLFLFCISNQISSSNKDEICRIKSPKSTHGGIFFKLEYHEMLFSWMGNMAKPRLQIFGGDQNCLHLRWTIFLFHFYENLQINFWRHQRMKQTSKRHNMKKWLPKPVCHCYLQHQIQIRKKITCKTFALRPVGKQVYSNWYQMRSFIIFE